MIVGGARRHVWTAVFVAATGVGFWAGHATRPVARTSAAASTGEVAGGAAGPGSGAAAGPTVIVRGGARAGNPLLAPGGADYNPAAAAVALEMDLGEIFEGETRDPAFAVRRERFLAEHFAAVLARHGPEVEVVGVECRSGTCRAVFEAPEDGWSPQLVQHIAWGSATETEEVRREGGRVTLELTGAMSHAWLDHETYERWQREWRTKMERDLEWLRAQRGARDVP